MQQWEANLKTGEQAINSNPLKSCQPRKRNEKYLFPISSCSECGIMATTWMHSTCDNQDSKVY